MIHPTAIVSPHAEIGSDVSIGPYAVIGDRVTIGSRCRIDSHAVLEGPTVIGPDNRIFPFAVIGAAPQDLKYHGEETFLTIGANNVFREYVNIHRGTSGGGGHTRIGDGNLLMVAAHVAHDCVVGSHVIMANAATLAGHVTIEDYVTLGAYSGVHQFCRVGAHGYVGGYSVITKDVLPYSRTVSPRATRAYGVNTIGLERRGFSAEQIRSIQSCFRLLLQSKMNTSQAVAAIREKVHGPEAELLVQFITSSERGVITD
jgi:UDP-N-acetylglucosamine acyltransferase